MALLLEDGLARSEDTKGKAHDIQMNIFTFPTRQQVTNNSEE